MNETTDPVLDALRSAARVHDVDLDTPEVRAAIARMDPAPRGWQPKRTVLAAAVAAAVAIVGGWQLVAPATDDRAAEPTVSADAIELVAARFDAAAGQFPLPKGQTYDTLRAEVLADAQDGEEFTVHEGTMPRDSAEEVMAVVARYSGCKWWEITAKGDLDKLSQALQAEAQKRTRAALAAVLRVTDDSTTIALPELWDELCKDVE